MGICLGTLQSVADSQLTEGYSRRFTKSMFGLSAMPTGGLKIAMTAADFEQYAPEYLEGQSISGVQRKLLVKLVGDQLVPAKGDGAYILKPTPPAIPYLSANEHAMMNLARAVKFKVAECAVLPFADGELGYVTKRFDLLPDGRRLFIEDGASLCKSHPVNKGDPDMWSYEAALRTLFLAAGKKLPIIKSGLEQVVFAYLIGNNDLHLKNFALYRQPDAKHTTMMDFTPLYDVLSVFPYDEYNKSDYLALSLTEQERAGQFSPEYEQYGDYSQFDFIRLGQTLGLNARAATRFVSALTDRVETHFQQVIHASLMPQEMQQTMIAGIQYRIHCMRRKGL